MATFAYNIVCQSRKVADVADLAQLVEQLIRNEQVVGSNPIISSINIADLAQLVEQLIRNEQVVGSSPIISSIEDYGSAFAEPFCCANCSLLSLVTTNFLLFVTAQ